MPTFQAADPEQERLLGVACAEALAAARWDHADLATRRPGADVSAMLLAKGAECALSPIGRDQLLSLALERVGTGDDSLAPLVDPRVEADRRTGIAVEVFRLGPHSASETRRLVEAIQVREAAPEVRTSRARLARRLRQEAALHEMLWDHPAIPAGPGVRLAMLCTIPQLRDRADELTAGCAWLRGLMMMADRARRGSSR